MFHPRKDISITARSAGLCLLLLTVLANVGSNAFATEYGVESANASDRPPTLAPDLASRKSEPDRPPSYGPDDAEVLVVLFSDYQCPACRRVTQATHQISAEFPGSVRIEVWHHPLGTIHSGAEAGAIAAIAAQRQGKFWEMHDLIFKNPSAMDMSTLEQHAQAIGLDMDQFREDMNDPAVRQLVEEQGALADALGARSTPGWVINGKVGIGWASWNHFRNNVALEVAASEKLAAQGMTAGQIREQRAMDNLADSESYALYRSKILGLEMAPE